MEATNLTPSFLCFLPELQCTPTNILYFNGITESNGIHHFSTKSIPLTLTKKKGSNGTLDLPNRSLEASAEACTGVSNGFVQNKVSVAGNSSHTEGVDIGSFAASMDGSSRAEHEQLGLAARTVSQSSDKGELGSFHDAECNGNLDLALGYLEEEDDLAFEIIKFFKAFEDGQEHNAMKYRENLSPESLSESKGNQLCVISNTASVDGQIRSDKLGIPGDEGSSDGRMYTNGAGGRSGKWNGYIEVDSFSATFSGPLTFSGPISYTGHVPYSGSISHRSDSSTASTHSFAFPILPCEWNSSPVKMAQPDQRYTKKPWKRRLLSCFCCTHSFN